MAQAVIAIVDDDQSVRDGVKDLLDSMGFIAKPFDCAETFLQSKYVSSASCLIADMRMPGLTGLELHELLAGLGKQIPTILITAFPNKADGARAKKSGVICCLTKPFNDDALLGCIRSALGANESNGTS